MIQAQFWDWLGKFDTVPLLTLLVLPLRIACAHLYFSWEHRELDLDLKHI